MVCRRLCTGGMPGDRTRTAWSFRLPPAAGGGTPRPPGRSRVSPTRAVRPACRRRAGPWVLRRPPGTARGRPSSLRPSVASARQPAPDERRRSLPVRTRRPGTVVPERRHAGAATVRALGSGLGLHSSGIRRPDKEEPSAAIADRKRVLTDGYGRYLRSSAVPYSRSERRSSPGACIHPERNR